MFGDNNGKIWTRHELSVNNAQCPTSVSWKQDVIQFCIKAELSDGSKHLCAWGNDAANEVLTEARLLLVENYFQTPS